MQTKTNNEHREQRLGSDYFIELFKQIHPADRPAFLLELEKLAKCYETR